MVGNVPQKQGLCSMNITFGYINKGFKLYFKNYYFTQFCIKPTSNI